MEKSNISESIITPIEPAEEQMSRGNTNMILTYQQYLHSTMYQLMHTAVGEPYDYSAFFYEDGKTYITDEDGVMLGIETE